MVVDDKSISRNADIGEEISEDIISPQGRPRMYGDNVSDSTIEDIIAGHEDRLLKLWLNEKEKNDNYEAKITDTFGHRRGGLTRSKNIASDKYLYAVRDLVDKAGIDDNSWETSIAVGRYLEALAVKKKLIEEYPWDDLE